MARFRPHHAHLDYPSLRDRKRLAWRLLVLRNLRLLDVTASRTEQKWAAGIAKAALTNAETTVGRDQQRFDQFIDDSVAELKRTIRRSGKPPGGKATRDALQSLEAETKTMRCDECRARTGHVCDGSLRDEVCLETAPPEGPPCMRLLLALFDDVVAIAEKAYAPVLDHGSGDLHLRLRALPAQSRRVESNATFPSSDRSCGRNTEVLIGLPMTSLEHRTVRSLPYLLFHEVFVHSPEAWHSPGRREHTRDTCALREGFVDAACATLLARDLDEHGLASPTYRRFSRIFSRAVRSSHGERMTYPDEQSLTVEEVARLEDIAEARNRGFELFKNLHRRHSAPTAIRFAVGLNLLDFSHDERERLVTVLEHTLDPDYPPLRNRHAWLRRLLALSTQGDIAQLKAAIAPELDPDF